MAFERATRKNAKLRLALSGTAGAGKTMSALKLAKIFGTKIAVMDSERGSASLYAGAPGIPEFDVCNLEEKRPQEYLEKIAEAAAAGYDLLIIDSYSHSWLSALEMIDGMGGWVRGGKVVSPLVQKIVDAVLSYPGHVIATMRSKAEHAIEKDEKTGKTTVRKIGMATVSRDGTDFEFSVMLSLDVDGGLSVSKTRCSALAGQYYTRDDIPKIGETIKTWLNEGAVQTPREAFTDKIKFAQTADALNALLPELAKLSNKDKAALRDAYTRRKTDLTPEIA